MMPGTNPSEMPSIACMPISPQQIVRDSPGSSADHQHVGVHGPERLAHADQRPAGADAGHQRVRQRRGQLLEDLGAEPLVVLVTFHSESNWPRVEVARPLAQHAGVLERRGHVEVADQEHVGAVARARSPTRSGLIPSGITTSMR